MKLQPTHLAAAAILLAAQIFSCQSRSPIIEPEKPTNNVVMTAQLCSEQICSKLRINHCHDGDTCQIGIPGGFWFNVRLAGIDAPEVGRFGGRGQGGQPFGQQSRNELLKILDKRTDLTIKQLDLDPFNRPIVEIYVGTECVNLKLLEMGLAERYQGKTKGLDQSRYDAAEQSAQKTKQGIWGMTDYKSPSKWRKENKKNQLN